MLEELRDQIVKGPGRGGRLGLGSSASTFAPTEHAIEVTDSGFSCHGWEDGDGEDVWRILNAGR